MNAQQAHGSVDWQGTDRQVVVVPDPTLSTTVANRFTVQVRFSRYGYDRILMKRVEHLEETIIIATKLNFKTACAISDSVDEACGSSYAQGYIYGRGLKQ